MRLGAQVPRDSHVSAPLSHPLRIPGHKLQACLQRRAAAGSTTAATPGTPKGLLLCPHRQAGSGWSPQRVPGSSSTGQRRAGTEESRVTLAMGDPRGGPWADPGKVALTVEKAGQRSEAGSPRSGASARQVGRGHAARRCDAQVCTWRPSNVCLKTSLFAPVYHWVNRRESPWGALPCIPGPLRCAQHQRCPAASLPGQSRILGAGQGGGDGTKRPPRYGVAPRQWEGLSAPASVPCLSPTQRGGAGFCQKFSWCLQSQSWNFRQQGEPEGVQVVWGVWGLNSH